VLEARVNTCGVIRCVLVGICLYACSDRPPPRGSGALETTPTGSAAHPRAPALISRPATLAYANGSVLTTDPPSCRVVLLSEGNTRWDRQLPDCGGLLEAVVAMDSMLYVRDSTKLSSFDAEGTLRWSAKLEGGPMSQAIAAPTAMADSRVALATTPRRVDVYERDGKVAWSFSPPSEEVLRTSPVAMMTEGMIVLSSRAAYYLGASGETRWRIAGPVRPSQP
jgi:outer membrane protein assembly factor BamB